MKTPPNDFLGRVNAILERNLDDESFTTKDLAREVFLCRMQLYRKMMEAAGIPPSEYMRKYRLKK